jgi:hypothetical protein
MIHSRANSKRLLHVRGSVVAVLGMARGATVADCEECRLATRSRLGVQFVVERPAHSRRPSSGDALGMDNRRSESSSEIDFIDG